jgi:hypothetical protein
VLLGAARGPAVQSRIASAKPKPGQPVSMTGAQAPALPTVEIIRGEKRATEVIR